MKKTIFLVTLLALILLAVLAGGKFLVKNFSGILPLIFSPKGTLLDVPGDALPISLPEGFSISIFASGLKAPRDLALAPDGTLLVSDMGAGEVVALSDKNNDGKADGAKSVASGLDRPHGMALHCAEKRCVLFVAETERVLVFDYDVRTNSAFNQRTFVSLPDGGRHVTRSLSLGTNESGDTLFISVGSTCDVCEEEDPRHASVLSVPITGDFSTEAEEPTVFANGLRNAVFIAINPETGELWGTEMGRDFLGDDLPPDEVNIIREGGWYGWPWFYGKNVEDAEFDPGFTRSFAREAIPSHVDLAAHVAPLGLTFVPAAGWPAEYRGDLLVAYHGSWNSSKPVGYKIARLRFDERGNHLRTDDFATGWLTEEKKILGRPADVLAGEGGRLFVSDDHAGVVYRIAHQVP